MATVSVVEHRFLVESDRAFRKADKVLRLVFKECRSPKEALLCLRLAEILLQESLGVKNASLEDEQELRAFVDEFL
jgi:hypothetical protein